MEYYRELKQLVLNVEDDFIKFHERGNQAAGTRIRKDMQCLKSLAQQIRVHISAIKNGTEED